MNRTKHLFLWAVTLCLLLSVTQLSAQDTQRVRVACVGNSITYGAGIQNRFQNSYPSYLQQFLGTGYDVRNFGVNGCTMLHNGDYPYTGNYAYREMQHFNPDIVIVKLGTNDSKPQNWEPYGKQFQQDMKEMIATLHRLPANPKIYLCLPVPATGCPGGIRDSVILNHVIPAIRRVAKDEKLPLIDLYTALQPVHSQCFPDHVHPDGKGASLLAATVFQAITGQQAPQAHDSSQAFPGNHSQWEGCDRYDFVTDGRQATVVVPKNAAPGKPWIWRPAFFDAFASVDKELLRRGFHIAYLDLTHLYGSPRSVELGNRFYQAMTSNYGLSRRVVVEGFSRGGYFAFNWAAANPDKVACLYVDAPVCDLTSWPGKKQADLWNGLLHEWNVTDVKPGTGFPGNALCHVDALVRNRIPVMAVCGGSDKGVPYDQNFLPVRQQLEERGGICEVIVKPDCDHHPHSLDDPTPVVDFILRHQQGYTQPQQINQRTLPVNALSRFVNQKKGTVAFLGGSITEMKGWRDMVKEDLHQRFPDTDFTFIEAGIASTGSTPHAFRLDHDVLSHGTPDLMFVEAAVNDDTNFFDSQAQVRGMEGIVRHALQSNPRMDIVLLHFIHDPFLPLFQSGQQPDVILNHERVANYYHLSSINLAQEVATRIQQGELNWEQFGGTHPAPRGHFIYTAAINRLFDQTMQELPQAGEPKAHAIPEKPLNEFSYTNGHFVDLAEATSLHGFRIVPDWDGAENVGKRPGFVHVPMLAAEKAGSSFSLTFQGRAVGIFCVSGPKAGILQYRVDKGAWKELNTSTPWSSGLYIPWVFMFETELPSGTHRLDVKIAKGDATECQIRNFVVN